MNNQTNASVCQVMNNKREDSSSRQRDNPFLMEEMWEVRKSDPIDQAICKPGNLCPYTNKTELHPLVKGVAGRGGWEQQII